MRLLPSGLGKVGYVGGHCVAKVKHRNIKALRAALENSNIGQTQEAQKSKVHILENLTASHCYLEQN
jgi:hypothetical protein